MTTGLFALEGDRCDELLQHQLQTNGESVPGVARRLQKVGRFNQSLDLVEK